MRRRHLLILNIYMMLVIAFVQNTFAQTTKEPLYIDLTKTLGFVMGQRFSLNRIKVEFPALSLRVQKADLEFKSTFGISEENVEKTLKDILKE